jgi:hypothetical protein
MVNALIFLNVITLIALLYIVYLSYKERQKLLDRIMAKNYTEFVDNEKPEDNDFTDGSEKYVDLEQAKSEIVK